MAKAAGIRDLTARVGKARNKMNVVKATWQALLSQKSVDEIRAYNGADSLAYISMDNLLEAVGAPNTQFCRACFDRAADRAEIARGAVCGLALPGFKLREVRQPVFELIAQRLHCARHAALERAENHRGHEAEQRGREANRHAVERRLHALDHLGHAFGGDG